MAAGCGGGAPAKAPVALTHEAYVWQRAWTGAVRQAVADAPPELSGLRVLTLEVASDGATRSPAISTEALFRAGRPITAVVRIDGARIPAAVSLAPALERIERWRDAGVPVAGLEIDHDCATAALRDYAVWLAARRPPGLRLSITALPTWAGAPDALRRVVAEVDEVVLQVHAVRAPTIFDAGVARRWVERFAVAAPAARVRVALPTYQVALGAADPDDVAGFLRTLERDPVPGVAGIVWFRLPVAADRTAWPAPVLAAVIRGAPHPRAFVEEPSHVR